jgi:hypothetical protein
LLQKIAWFVLAFITVDGSYNLAKAPIPPGPTTPTSLIMTLNSVDIAVDARNAYTTILDNPTSIDVVGQTGLPGAVFGAGFAKFDEYKAVRLTLSATGRYTGIDPCTGDSVSDAEIQLPESENGLAIINYMVRHPVQGLKPGYRQMLPLQLGGDPVDFRIVFQATHSVVCSSSAVPLRTISGDLSQMSLPQGVALYRDQAGDPSQDEIVVANNTSNKSRITIFHRTDKEKPIPLQSLEGVATGLSKSIGVYVDADHNEIGVANNGNNSITIYDRQAIIDKADPNNNNIANVAPYVTISGSNTGLNSPGMIAHTFDPLNPSPDEILVANGGTNSVTIYDRADVQAAFVGQLIGNPVSAAGTSVDIGDTLTLRINGDPNQTTTFVSPDAPVIHDGAAIASLIQKLVRDKGYSGFTANFDGSRYTLTSGTPGPNSSVIVTGGSKAGDFQLSQATGPAQTRVSNVSPRYTLMGSSTGLSIPCGISVDTVDNEIGVANNGNNSITVYSLTDLYNSIDGNVPPLQTIIGPDTGINVPCGLYVDKDEIGVANNASDSVTIFSRLATGNIPPIRRIQGDAAGIKYPWGIYVDTINNEIGVTNIKNDSLTIHSLDDPTVQLKSLPDLIISSSQQVLFPEYIYSGAIDKNTQMGDPTSIQFDGYHFTWRVTDERIRQPGDASGGLLLPPSDVIFGLSDGHNASYLPFACPQLTPFIILTLTTNCPAPPLVVSPLPVVAADYLVPASLFNVVVVTRIRINATPLQESEFPRPIPTFNLASDSSIQGIDWKYVDGDDLDLPSPLIYSQQFSITLKQPYNKVSSCYQQVQGNNDTLVFASASLPRDLRSLDVIKNNGCDISINDLDTLVFTYNDAISSAYVFTFKLN